MASKYKPGDQVLPKTHRKARTREERRAEEEDRRLIEEVRELSLRDAGVSSSLPPHTRRRQDSRSGDERTRSGRDRSLDGRARRGHRRPHEERARASADHIHSDSERRRRRRSESQQRQVEHQSSLRSLIGSVDMSERDIEREIEDFARQIQEEGLLDGLDLDNIDLTRDDELSRRVTEAYRRRQRERARHESSRRNTTTGHSSSSRNLESNSRESRRLVPESTSRPQSRTRPHSRSASATSQSEERSRPPASMASANLEVRDPTTRRRRRTASGSRSATTPIFPVTTPENRSAARSQTDLTVRAQNSDTSSSRPSLSDGRSSSTPTVPAAVQSPTELPASLSFASRVPHGNPQQGNLHGTSNVPRPSSTQPEATSREARSHRPTDLAIVHSAVTSPIKSPPMFGHQRTGSQLFPEPSISCARCNKAHIEYELHYNCSICSNGQWNMCLDCYRSGKGCLYWFGFGYGAWHKWEKARQQDNSLAKPHMLTACRYAPPRSIPGGAEGRKTLTTEDPKKRLQSGTFCVRCYSWTNECYWRCDTCNEGDWGFCNNCVNQGRSCTHMLLPLAHEATQSGHDRPGTPRSPGRPPTATILTGPNASNIGPFKPLTFATRCDVCQDPIPPSQARYHCFSCTSSLVQDAAPGDYDICSSCYGNLVTQGQISVENGHSGWRRCLNGHRMVIVAFTDGRVGQWRYVAQDVVGGRSLRCEAFKDAEHQGEDLQKWTWGHGSQATGRLVTKQVSETAPTVDNMAQRFPPDGGLGMRAVARWGWYPQAGVDDELLFPRGAEIREIEDVSEDWFFGVYMGARGLFPAPYVRREQSSS